MLYRSASSLFTLLLAMSMGATPWSLEDLHDLRAEYEIGPFDDSTKETETWTMMNHPSQIVPKIPHRNLLIERLQVMTLISSIAVLIMIVIIAVLIGTQYARNRAISRLQRLEQQGLILCPSAEVPVGRTVP